MSVMRCEHGIEVSSARPRFTRYQGGLDIMFQNVQLPSYSCILSSVRPRFTRVRGGA